ncbi:uncharacterized protein [Euwallacea fornicatus]|uniref:uncharacterized protein isoform X2 n=1 Tax=Euwallacea fornicatus TaxID=995702 RepID=UPI00338E7CC4
MVSVKDFQLFSILQTRRSSTIMETKWGLFSLLSAYLVTLSMALPSALVEEIKNSEVKTNKVKRAQPDQLGPEENIGKLSYFGDKQSSAIKRGTNLKETDLGDWTGDFNMDNIQSGLLNSPNLPMEDKTMAEYEKGYRYAINRDKLDEDLENAVLKGDLYVDPYNQYRAKRNVDLTPEEVMALLALYDKNQRGLKNSYDGIDADEDDETWLNSPVYPYGTVDRLPDNYLYNHANRQLDYKPHWGNFDLGTAKKKRFVVAQNTRTSDPTRMIRYINGPNQNDFNTLSNILNNQKEGGNVDIPVYHRLVL